MALLPSAVRAGITPYSSEAAWLSQVGTPSLIDFEGVSGSITNQYPGVTFSGINGGGPVATSLVSYQGSQSIFVAPGETAGGGGYAIEFSSPQSGVAFFTGDLQFSGSMVRLFSGASLIDQFDLAATIGPVGNGTWGFNGFASSQTDITRVEVQANDFDAVWFDNIQYATSASAAPEPGAFALMALGLCGSALAVRRRRRA